MYVSLNWTVNLLHENFCDSVMTLFHFLVDHIPKEPFAKGSILGPKNYIHFNLTTRDITRAQKTAAETQKLYRDKTATQNPKRHLVSYHDINIISTGTQ